MPQFDDQQINAKTSLRKPDISQRRPKGVVLNRSHGRRLLIQHS